MSFRLHSVCLGFAAAFSLFAANAAVAGNGSGKVVSLLGNSSQLFGLTVGTINGRPACAQSNEFAIDNRTPGGKAMIAIVLAAQAQGLTVSVVGTGTCDVWGDRESVSYLVAH